MSTPLRFGVQGLPAAEAALVRTLFKLYQHGTGDFRWELVDAPPYHAVLVDFNATLVGHEPAKAVLTIGPSSLGALPNSLVRPLRSEMLEAWLMQTQRRFISAAAPSEPKIQQQTPPASAASLAGCQETGSHKLLRWPPAAMLRNDPRLIRMATVLARRPVTAGELARVSQQPLDSACAFLTTLRNAALLDSSMLAQSRLQSGPASAMSGPAPTAPKIERGLMNRIRLRLGL
jgi:hypothetical protein